MAPIHSRQVEYPTAREVADVAAEERLNNRSDHSTVDLLRLFWDNRRFLGRALLYGLILATVIAFLIPRRFTSTVRLMPPDPQSNSGMALIAAISGKSSMLSGVAGDLLGNGGTGPLFVGILQSRTVQDRLIQRFNLKKVYWDRLDEDARKDLAERTSVTEDRKSGIITIMVSDHDPNRATAMARAYIEELNRLSAQLSTSAAHRERVFLEDRLKAVKEDLDKASVDFSQFASKNTAIDIKEQGRAMVEAAARLQGELIVAESEARGLEAIYTSNNVRVRALQARIAELHKQLAALGGPAGGNLAGSEDSSIASYPSIRELPILGVTYADLYRRTKIQETVFETLTQQYELAKVQEAKETPSIKTLDDADVPERKSFPPRLGIMFLGAVLSLVGGAFWLVGRQRWHEAESDDPLKVFAEEVFYTIRARVPWGAQNGSGGKSVGIEFPSRPGAGTMNSSEDPD